MNITGRAKFKVETYFAILNQLKSEVEKRCDTYNNNFS